MLTHQEWVSSPPRYLLVPNSSETNGAATAVDPGNQKEAAPYRRYLAAKQATPASKEALLAYYREVVG